MDVPYADLEICLRLGLAVMGGPWSGGIASGNGTPRAFGP
jgi:hypothetical protein